MSFFNKNTNKKFRILSIDGGGMKGVFTAYALMRLEEEYNIKVLDHFDMIVGTSTGALIASALLMGNTGKEIYDIYIDKENPSFVNQKSFREQFNSTFYAGYDVIPLEKQLKLEFGEMTLDDLYKRSKKTFAFFSTNFTKAQPIIYSSPNIRNIDNSKMVVNKTTVFEALRTSTSAPFYFEPYLDKDNEMLLDGGLWANNPSLAGINLALAQEKNLKVSDIEVLSFGQTFTEDIEYKITKGRELLKNPMKNQLSLLLMSVLTTNQNAQTSQVKYLIGDKLFRYTPEIEQKGVSVNKVDTKFINYSKIYWQQNKEQLANFILTGENSKK